MKILHRESLVRNLKTINIRDYIAYLKDFSDFADFYEYYCKTVGVLVHHICMPTNYACIYVYSVQM